LNGVDLRGASFKRAELYQADFDHSDLRGTAFDHAFIVGTFNSTCVSNASFVGARFNMDPEGVEYSDSETTFVGAYGQGIDFRDAVNLSSVRLGPGVTSARFAGAKERPKAARPARSFDNAGPCHGSSPEVSAHG
jgi:uncharacterized protein YjbI with pentapeptide repeats